MLVRLWFWSLRNPVPRVIAHGSGDSIEQAMVAAFAPVYDRAWQHKYEHGKLFLTRGPASYRGEVVELTSIPRNNFCLVKQEHGWYISANGFKDLGPYWSKGEALADLQAMYPDMGPREPRQRLELPKLRQRLTLPRTRQRL